MMKTSFIGVGSGVVDAPFSSTSFYLDGEFKWLKLKVSFSKKGWYSIFVWDPADKLRIQSLYINEPKEIILSVNHDETSYSSVPGLILQGEWKLEILAATYKANPEYKFTFECGLDAAAGDGEADKFESWTGNVKTLAAKSSIALELNTFNDAKVLKTSSRWYKGDFHTHTNESDGKMSPREGMDQAKKMGLDYFAVTDHNIIPTKWIKDDMLTIPGIEITSSKGHFNALGLKQWVDWRPTCTDGGMETEEGMNRVIGEVRSAGALVSINHPMLQPWEWQFRTTPLSLVDVIEIWNDPTYKDNPAATEEALQLWDILWNDGHRIYGIGGSDSHLRPDESYEKNGPPSVIGDPATYVFADGLSALTILDGVKNGNVYVTRGPVLDCQVYMDSSSYKPGSEIGANVSGDTVEFDYQVNYENIETGASLHWILNGNEYKKVLLNPSRGTTTETFQWKKSGPNWLRLEIRGNNGQLLAITNPVYCGEKKTTLQTWGELIDKFRAVPVTTRIST
ncbi:CehA/McbA family metallohydrolase [Mesobacillus selenatarsenatis]|nr:CehA/McbA family metallohydrolase [Mesobacillus selenatarsenatis]